MEALLTSLGLVVTSTVGIVGSVATAVVAQPLLLIPFGFGLLGAGIAVVKRFA